MIRVFSRVQFRHLLTQPYQIPAEPRRILIPGSEHGYYSVASKTDQSIVLCVLDLPLILK